MSERRNRQTYGLTGYGLGEDERAHQLREERDNIGALAARRLDEIDRLREALRETRQALAVWSQGAPPAVMEAVEILDSALGDTPDE
jgi:short subunit dehydrogenase-like uncharacterized protein